MFTENLDHQPDYTDKHVDLDEIMLPQLLKQRDYHSIILGKWHLGGQAGRTPNDRGFDEFLGFLAGAAAYAGFDDPEHIKSIQEFDPIDQFLWPNLSFAVRYNRGPRFTPSKALAARFQASPTLDKRSDYRSIGGGKLIIS
ncbi:MAG: sulfatase-like hydrolase/transferase [Gammaproteobacteria bacterium]|nr:sulfatase-like hydrolase/transferase [Gammaproteobacteria bacterium]